MWKSMIIMFFLFSYYSCLENNEMIAEETRAKKKKGSAKLLGLILLLVVSKIAVFKTISVFLMMKFFQKLFAIGGILLKYLLNSKGEKPSPVYGAPSYDTVGYSYGPESARPQDDPGISDIASSFDWLVNTNL